MAHHNVPNAMLANGPWTVVNTIASLRRIRLRRSCVWELAVAVCRNCLADKGEGTQGKQHVSNGGRGTTLERHTGEPLIWSFNDAMLNSITRQVCIRFEVELCQNAGTIGADSFYAEGELIGNVSNRAPGRDQAEHLVLTIR